MNANEHGNPDYSSAYLAECLSLAREASGKTASECAHLLGINPGRLRSYESGKLVPSLPEIESLSYIYKIPLPAFFNPQILAEYIHEPDAEQLKQLLDIRREIIATRLQLAREQSGKSQSEVAKAAAIPVSRLKKYEHGDLGIAFNDLQKICPEIGLSLDEVFDKDSPIGIWQTEKENSRRFNQLAEESREFALSPDNQQFILFTQRLKTINRENLSSLSDSLRQIMDSFPKD